MTSASPGTSLSYSSMILIKVVNKGYSDCKSEDDPDQENDQASASSVVIKSMLPHTEEPDYKAQVCLLEGQLASVQDEPQRKLTENKLLPEQVKDLRVQVIPSEQQLNQLDQEIQEIKKSTATKSINTRLERTRDCTKKEAAELRCASGGDELVDLRKQAEDLMFAKDVLQGKLASLQTKSSEVSGLLTSEPPVDDPWSVWVLLIEHLACAPWVHSTRCSKPKQKPRTPTAPSRSVPPRRKDTPTKQAASFDHLQCSTNHQETWTRSKSNPERRGKSTASKKQIKVPLLGASNPREMSRRMQTRQCGTTAFYSPGSRLQDKGPRI